jgi:hypothetical protein
MGLDIRFPIGWMFTVIGLTLAVYGLVTNGDAAMYARSLQINVNLWWGGVLTAFGVLMWALALVSKRKNSAKK